MNLFPNSNFNTTDYPALKRIPNLLTLIRIMLAPVFLILFLQEDWMMRLAAVIVFTVAAITDYLDGYLARVLQAHSAFGNFMDPLADKVLTFLGFASLSILNAELFPWWAFALIVGRDVFVTWMRTLANKRGKAMQTSYTAKLKTAIQLIFLYIALLAFTLVMIPITNEFMTVWLFDSGLLTWLYLGVMVFTVYTGFQYIYNNREIFKPAKARNA
ncbi:MAG: CDP-diacylglycerol--glycerol-3-phosphate 3-phosphatidyltransferase [Balneolia bacterium]|nr:CDP-diacylglycerol--glycerol-3-phosphate 3-phosphatidyltransferase [Balneolia bacterium]